MSGMERWLPVVGYEGLYEVSDLGRVRRIDAAPGTWAGRFLTPTPVRSGYLVVSLSRKHHTRRFRVVHRIVLMAFVGPPPTSEHQVNHRDCDKRNNALTNLEWVTRKQNMEHAVVNGRLANRPQRSVLTPGKVVGIRALRGSATQKAIAERYGVSKSLVGAVMRGEAWRDVGDQAPRGVAA